MPKTNTNTFVNIIKKALKNQKDSVKESEWVQFFERY